VLAVAEFRPLAITVYNCVFTDKNLINAVYDIKQRTASPLKH